MNVYKRGTSEELGVHVHPATDSWRTAASLERLHGIPLWDAFSAATARATDAALLVGPDDHFDDVEGVELVRFRDGSA